MGYIVVLGNSLCAQLYPKHLRKYHKSYVIVLKRVFVVVAEVVDLDL